MTTSALLFSDFKSSYDQSVAANLTLDEYFQHCRNDPMTYGLAAERMVKAIGEPRLVATKSDPRLLRLFGKPGFSTSASLAACFNRPNGQ